MGRQTCSQKLKLKRGLWSPEEDQKLINHITKFGHGCWSSVPKQAGLQRCGKSCRLRWMNYLRPDLKRGAFSKEEDGIIIQLHALFGNSWSAIAARLPGRTDNAIKNHWNSFVKKRMQKESIEHGASHLTTNHSTITYERTDSNAIEGSSSNDCCITAKKCFKLELDSVSEYLMAPSSSYENEVDANIFISCSSITEWLDLAPKENASLNFEHSDFSWADGSSHM